MVKMAVAPDGPGELDALGARLPGGPARAWVTAALAGVLLAAGFVWSLVWVYLEFNATLSGDSPRPVAAFDCESGGVVFESSLNAPKGDLACPVIPDHD